MSVSGRGAGDCRPRHRPGRRRPHVWHGARRRRPHRQLRRTGRHASDFGAPGDVSVSADFDDPLGAPPRSRWRAPTHVSSPPRGSWARTPRWRRDRLGAGLRDRRGASAGTSRPSSRADGHRRRSTRSRWAQRPWRPRGCRSATRSACGPPRRTPKSPSDDRGRRDHRQRLTSENNPGRGRLVTTEWIGRLRVRGLADPLVLALAPDADADQFRAELRDVAPGSSKDPSWTARSSTCTGCNGCPCSSLRFVGVLAIASLAHALVMSVRRQHSQLAILKSPLGFRRRQVQLAVAFHATVLVLAAAVVGSRSASSSDGGGGASSPTSWASPARRHAGGLAVGDRRRSRRVGQPRGRLPGLARRSPPNGPRPARGVTGRDCDGWRVCAAWPTVGPRAGAGPVRRHPDRPPDRRRHSMAGGVCRRLALRPGSRRPVAGVLRVRPKAWLAPLAAVAAALRAARPPRNCRCSSPTPRRRPTALRCGC